MISWNDYVKTQRVKINKKRKREKLEPLSYKECLKVCSETWKVDKAKLVKKMERMKKKLNK